MRQAVDLSYREGYHSDAGHLGKTRHSPLDTDGDIGQCMPCGLRLRVPV